MRTSSPALNGTKPVSPPSLRTGPFTWTCRPKKAKPATEPQHRASRSWDDLGLAMRAARNHTHENGHCPGQVRVVEVGA